MDPWDRFIDLHLYIVDIYGKCIGRYTIHVNPMANYVQTSLVLAYIYK